VNEGKPKLTSFGRMSVSPVREARVLLELAAFCFLTQRHVDDVLFGESTLSPGSRQVIEGSPEATAIELGR
jgi:hypothetical protein